MLTYMETRGVCWVSCFIPLRWGPPTLSFETGLLRCGLQLRDRSASAPWSAYIKGVPHHTQFSISLFKKDLKIFVYDFLNLCVYVCAHLCTPEEGV